MLRIQSAMTAILLLLGWATPAWTQFHVLLEPSTARLIHLPGFRGGIPGGVPSSTELYFGLKGELDITFVEDTARFATVDLTLHGNEQAFEGREELRSQIEQEARQVLLDGQFIVTTGPPRDRTELRATFAPFDDELVLEFFRNTLVHLQGGRNLTPLDGPGYLFAYPVPEPCAAALAIVGGVAVCLRSRRLSTPSFGSPDRSRGPTRSPR